MKIKKSILVILATSLMLPSCIVSQAVEFWYRDEYPGQRPPSAIADAGGKPAFQKWIKKDNELLPPPSRLIDNTVSYSADGTPYGFTSEFSNIVVSPYSPHYVLDYTRFSGGDKVWDPYSRKPFYIPRIHTIN